MAGGECMDNSQNVSWKMITEMENHTRKLGVKRVIVVASMDDAGSSWVSHMKAVDIITSIPEDPQQQEYPGHNAIAIAYCKAAEMADTKLNSGSKARSAYQGEFGHPGGLIKQVQSGFNVTVFSGASGEQDVAIAKVGMDGYQKAR